MNFLSHFFHELPCNDPYITAGVLLPDILSHYSYRNKETVKLHVNKLVDSDNVNLQGLIIGVKKHYAADAAFHGSDFFTYNTNTIETIIRKYMFGCFQKRLYAFSHVFLEIMLDRKILKENISVCDTMYALLKQADEHIIEQFIGMNTIAKNPNDVMAHFHHFVKQRFVYDYLHDNVIIHITDRLNQRIGNKPYNATDFVHIISLIHDTEKALFSQRFPNFHI